MRPERLAELESYYSQDDDLVEAHGAVLELVYEVKRLQGELRAARDVVDTLRIYDEGPMGLPAPMASVLAAYDRVVAG